MREYDVHFGIFLAEEDEERVIWFRELVAEHCRQSGKPAPTFCMLGRTNDQPDIPTIPGHIEFTAGNCAKVIVFLSENFYREAAAKFKAELLAMKRLYDEMSLREVGGGGGDCGIILLSTVPDRKLSRRLFRDHLGYLTMLRPRDISRLMTLYREYDTDAQMEQAVRRLPRETIYGTDRDMKNLFRYLEGVAAGTVLRGAAAQHHQSTASEVLPSPPFPAEPAPRQPAAHACAAAAEASSCCHQQEGEQTKPHALAGSAAAAAAAGATASLGELVPRFDPGGVSDAGRQRTAEETVAPLQLSPIGGTHGDRQERPSPPPSQVLPVNRTEPPDRGAHARIDNEVLPQPEVAVERGVHGLRLRDDPSVAAVGRGQQCQGAGESSLERYRVETGRLDVRTANDQPVRHPSDAISSPPPASYPGENRLNLGPPRSDDNGDQLRHPGAEAAHERWPPVSGVPEPAAVETQQQFTRVPLRSPTGCAQEPAQTQRSLSNLGSSEQMYQLFQQLSMYFVAQPSQGPPAGIQGGTLGIPGGAPGISGGAPGIPGGATRIPGGAPGFPEGLPGYPAGAPLTQGGVPATPWSQHSIQGIAPVTQGGTPATPWGQYATQGGAPVAQGGAPAIPWGQYASQGGAPMFQVGAPVTHGGAPAIPCGQYTPQGGAPVTQVGAPATQGGAPATPWGQYAFQGGAPVTQGGAPGTQSGALGVPGGAPTTLGSVPVTQGGAPVTGEGMRHQTACRQHIPYESSNQSQQVGQFSCVGSPYSRTDFTHRPQGTDQGSARMESSGNSVRLPATEQTCRATVEVPPCRTLSDARPAMMVSERINDPWIHGCFQQGSMGGGEAPPEPPQGGAHSLSSSHHRATERPISEPNAPKTPVEQLDESLNNLGLDESLALTLSLQAGDDRVIRESLQNHSNDDSMTEYTLSEESSSVYLEQIALPHTDLDVRQEDGVKSMKSGDSFNTGGAQGQNVTL